MYIAYDLFKYYSPKDFIYKTLLCFKFSFLSFFSIFNISEIIGLISPPTNFVICREVCVYKTDDDLFRGSVMEHRGFC